MSAPDLLAAIRADLREHQPYRPVFQEDDICPVCSGYGSVGVVAWPCGPLRMAEALDAVLALADRWEHGALRWADPLPVPPEVEQVRAAIVEKLGGGA